MYALTVANDRIAIRQFGSGMDLVDHDREINRAAGIGIDALAGVMAKDAQADFLARTAMDCQRIVAATIRRMVGQRQGPMRVLDWPARFASTRNSLITETPWLLLSQPVKRRQS